MGVFLAFLLIAFEEIGWVLAIGATVIALFYIRRDSVRVRRLYWTTFYLVIAGNLILLLSGGIGLWRHAMFGPPPFDRLAEPIEHLNIINFWLLLFFALVPVWRRKRRRLRESTGNA